MFAAVVTIGNSFNCSLDSVAHFKWKQLKKVCSQEGKEYNPV